MKALGSAGSNTRTQAQTDLAYFYSGNLIDLWQRTLRGIASANLNNIGDSARLFALANMAAADAVITAWDNKRILELLGDPSQPFMSGTTTAIRERPVTRIGAADPNTTLS